MSDSSPLTLHNSYEGTVESLAFGGEGITRINQFVVFIPHAIPGDVVQFRVTEIKKSFGRAVVEKILKPAATRVEPPCPIYYDCGGCQLQEMGYQAALEEKSKILEGLLSHQLHLPKVPMAPPLPSPIPYAYRNKMQLAVRKTSTTPLALGLYQPSSHVIVDMPTCPIQQEANNTLIPVLREGMKTLGWSAYDEKSHAGLIRHFLARTNQMGETYLVIIATELVLPQWETFLSLVQKASPKLQGLALNVNGDKTNRVLGKATKVLWGKNFLQESIGSYLFAFGPTDFFQTNSFILARLIDQVLEWGHPTSDASVLDVYCGVGTFTIPLAKKAKHVIGIEENADAIFWAKENSRKNEVQNTEFHVGKAEEILPTLQSDVFSLVFLDPPRKGLTPNALKELVRLNPPKILYLSCNPPTLVRDLQVLLKAGWNLTHVLAADLFPQTAHIEALALLEKA